MLRLSCEQLNTATPKGCDVTEFKADKQAPGSQE
jgi:hypothetical protein